MCCALWRHLPILNIWRLKGLTALLMFLFFVLYHLMLSGHFYGSEIRHRICFWHITHSSSKRSFQGHVISSTTPSQQNLTEKQIFWGTDLFCAPGCVYFLVIFWFILTDFYTMTLHINATLRAVVSPGRTLRFDGKETTASNRLLFHRACASTWWLRISNDKTATKTSTKQ